MSTTSLLQAPTQALVDLSLPMGTNKNSLDIASGGAVLRKSFNAWDDVLLCRAVNARKPWTAPSGEIMLYWAEIADTLMRTRGFGVKKDGPACKTRFEKILRMTIGGEKEMLRKTGTDDEYDERERLLRNMYEQIDQYRDGRDGDVSHKVLGDLHEDAESLENKRKRKGKALARIISKRERLMDSITGSAIASTPPTRDEFKSIFEYLQRRMEIDDAREERRMLAEKEMEERRTAAEERRMASELERDRQQQEFMVKVLNIMQSK
ncbi:hypothetical protein SDRG_12398 [Saprolegnia diclina VS20]|uniref:Myb-like domain-containing protein n=1 Tax=Saprolegnia diclina (strain VS20) TaxID=1156394 RepID=T0RIY8_SAPDV|nr:hypothetical protein SDRG_12398 [Saprolegnia diclina VS20]EQC29852.1 hypothetical protein SDRG_12398 [Saprolegnia diclina VS20]|eukprot:XP_008616691.1 hypothetical protein SDRG_12398 [Saprolegnia diclina VS20]